MTFAPSRSFAEAEAGIRQLHARYTDAVWRQDVAEFGRCFTEDGEWRISGMVLKGRVQIEDMIGRIFQNAERVLMTFRTPLLDVGEGRATGRTYVTEQCTWKHRPPNHSIGRYYERFLEQDGVWRFQWRLFELHYTGPADLTGEWKEHPDYGPAPAMPPLDVEVADHASDKWGLNKP